VDGGGPVGRLFRFRVAFPASDAPHRLRNEEKHVKKFLIAGSTNQFPVEPLWLGLAQIQPGVYFAALSSALRLDIRRKLAGMPAGVFSYALLLESLRAFCDCN
jgi:hypothetical protein